ncbi:hypothetical protein [Streptomyces sp. SS]|uniref:hypothetical protein n=1 Tax=Streptomyces sp. SS TaxID=260742 RepID=UPI0002E90161|nr:hypothetical protein [Streptomyces sp. SS]
MTPTTPAPTTDDFARTTRNLRFTALGGFLVLAALLVLTAMLALGDAVSGDGAGGAFTDAAFWMFPFAAAAGLVALVTPRDLMPTTPRRALVIAQYALGIAGVFLQTLD